MDPVIGAVVIAGLTTIGKPTAEALTAVLGKIVSPSADAIGQGIAVSLQAWAKRRAELASGTVIGAAKLLYEAKIEPQPVPGRLLMPILEHASLEEDEQLQRKWAALLANAASPQSPDHLILPAYAEILRQLTPVHARFMDYMKPKRDSSAELEDYRKGKMDDEIKEEGRIGVIGLDYELVANDLHRLQLIEPVAYGSGYGGVRITQLGRSFIDACTPPRPFR